MSDFKPISSALISVYHKEELEPLLSVLHQQGVQLFSTGGTQQYIKSKNYPVTAVEDLTGYPSILGGRVKTLHPKIFGGILARRNEPRDLQALESLEIPSIDLVVVDLYPFEETVAQTENEAEIIEKIDIGGIALIRATAKNYKDTVIVSHRGQYAQLIEWLTQHPGGTHLKERQAFAREAFAVSSGYDTAIFNYFNNTHESAALRVAAQPRQSLRYGENPHQKGEFYGAFHELFDQIHGKAISYNNLLDIDAAVNLIEDFEETTFAILKHNNACGAASRPVLKEAYLAALAGDPVSAFGGILVTNTPLDAATAEEVNKLFFEVIIAPSYQPDALEILKQKKNRIILIKKQSLQAHTQYKSVLNGLLAQEKDTHTESAKDWKQVTQQPVNKDQTEDLIFGNKIVKHSKSNAIVLAKNKQLLASGVGETSRVDALKHAIEKARNFSLDLQGASMASDAFFPFADSVQLAFEAGIRAVIQPGGSKRDQDSIDFCDNNQIAMVFTGIRHFKH